MLIAGLRHLRAGLDKYVEHLTSIARIGPGTCGHQTTTPALRHRSPTWRQRGYNVESSSAG
jgi:hypothetical protein